MNLFTAFAELRLEDMEYRRGLKRAEQAAKDSGDILGASIEDGVVRGERALERMGSRMQNVGTMLTRHVTIPLKVLSTTFILAASDAEETGSKFDTVFRDIGDSADRAAQRVSDSFGLSSTNARRLLGDTGDLLTGFGFAQDAALDLSEQVAGLGVDLASFTNFQGGAEGAARALTSAMLGETESLKSLGIAISQADVDTEVLAMAQEGLTFETDRQAKAQATLRLAMRQSTNAIGDYSRTSGSFANQTRGLNQELNELGVALGEHILPLVTRNVSHVRELVKWFADLPEPVHRVTVLLGGLAAAAGPLTIGFGMLLTNIRAVRGALMALRGVTLLGMGPVGWVALAATAIAGLALGFAGARDRTDLKSAIEDTEAAMEGLKNGVSGGGASMLAALDDLAASTGGSTREAVEALRDEFVETGELGTESMEALKAIMAEASESATEDFGDIATASGAAQRALAATDEDSFVTALDALIKHSDDEARPALQRLRDDLVETANVSVAAAQKMIEAQQNLMLESMRYSLFGSEVRSKAELLFTVVGEETGKWFGTAYDEAIAEFDFQGAIGAVHATIAELDRMGGSRGASAESIFAPILAELNRAAVMWRDIEAGVYAVSPLGDGDDDDGDPGAVGAPDPEDVEDYTSRSYDIVDGYAQATQSLWRTWNAERRASDAEIAAEAAALDDYLARLDEAAEERARSAAARARFAMADVAHARERQAESDWFGLMEPDFDPTAQAASQAAATVENAWTNTLNLVGGIAERLSREVSDTIGTHAYEVERAERAAEAARLDNLADAREQMELNAQAEAIATDTYLAQQEARQEAAAATLSATLAGIAADRERMELDREAAEVAREALDAQNRRDATAGYLDDRYRFRQDREEADRVEGAGPTGARGGRGAGGGITDDLAEAHRINLQKEIDARQALIDGLFEVSAANGPLKNFGNALMAEVANSIPLVGTAIEGFVQGGPIGALTAVFTELLGRSEVFQRIMSKLNDILEPIVGMFDTLLGAIEPIIDVAIALVEVALQPFVWLIENVVAPVLQAFADVVEGIYNFLAGLFGWDPVGGGADGPTGEGSQASRARERARTMPEQYGSFDEWRDAGWAYWEQDRQSIMDVLQLEQEYWNARLNSAQTEAEIGVANAALARVQDEIQRMRNLGLDDGSGGERPDPNAPGGQADFMEPQSFGGVPQSVQMAVATPLVEASSLMYDAAEMMHTAFAGGADGFGLEALPPFTSAIERLTPVLERMVADGVELRSGGNTMSPTAHLRGF